MEKFGLFRLLSALTGEIAAEKEAPDARPDGADAGAADGADAANESREAGALAQPAGEAAAGGDHMAYHILLVDDAPEDGIVL